MRNGLHITIYEHLNSLIKERKAEPRDCMNAAETIGAISSFVQLRLYFSFGDKATSAGVLVKRRGDEVAAERG